MPPQDDEALPDVAPGAGRGDCESALIATEATNNNSQSQQDAVLQEVGAVASTENNAEEDADTAFITAESQTHADDLATSCSNFRRGGVAEAEEVCETFYTDPISISPSKFQRSHKYSQAITPRVIDEVSQGIWIRH